MKLKVDHLFQTQSSGNEEENKDEEMEEKKDDKIEEAPLDPYGNVRALDSEFEN